MVWSMKVRPYIAAAGAVLVALSSAGCAAVEENPLSVNSPRSEANVSAVEASPADFGDDPLNLAENGASLCSSQPDIGFQEFTVLVHNEALETFTLEDISLADPLGLTLVSAEVSPANRDGHHKAHGDAGGAGHGGHSTAPATAAPDETAEPAGPVEPVPAQGYTITTHEYINLVVAVSIEDGADAGTAQGITVGYSTGDAEFTGTHPLKVELNREGCA